MLKLYLTIIFAGILYNFSIDADTKTKEKVYYKHIESTTAADKSESALKDVIPIAVEGQSELLKSIKLNSVKINSIRENVKKGSKTVPRKGVLNSLKDDIESSDILALNSTLKSFAMKQTNVSHIISTNNLFIDSSKILISTEKSNTVHVAPVKEILREEEIFSIGSKIKNIKKPKPKPEVTVGEKEADEPIPASPTIRSPLGMPRKIDYIVPVIITITALPLLGAAFYVLYKRGRDYWDKRHYRRMDFLIDGMYNE